MLANVRCRIFSSLIFRKEHSLSLFDIMIKRKIFGLKREDVTGDWRRSHVELHDLLSSLNISQVIKSGKMRWMGHVTPIGGRRVANRVLVGKP